MYLSRKQIKSICTHCSIDEDTVFRGDRGVVHLVDRRLRGCIFTFRHSRTSNSIVTNLYRGRRQHRYFSSTDTYQERVETQQAGYDREDRDKCANAGEVDDRNSRNANRIYHVSENVLTAQNIITTEFRANKCSESKI